MLGKILKLFVGDKSKKDLKEINPIIEKIHSFEDEINSLSNDELRQQTVKFKDHIQKSISDLSDKIEKTKDEIEIDRLAARYKKDINKLKMSPFNKDNWKQI